MTSSPPESTAPTWLDSAIDQIPSAPAGFPSDLARGLHEATAAVLTAHGTLAVQQRSLARVHRLHGMKECDLAPQAAEQCSEDAKRSASGTADDYAHALASLVNLQEHAKRSRAITQAPAAAREAIHGWTVTKPASVLVEAVRAILAAESVLPEPEPTPVPAEFMVDLDKVAAALEQLKFETTP